MQSAHLLEGRRRMIAPELARFLESGVSVLVGTRDARLEPECVRAAGARVAPSGGELTVFLPLATSARTLANLADNGCIAAFFSRASDHRSVQVKGRLLGVADAGDPDRAAVEGYRAALALELAKVGVPPQAVARMVQWPCRAARFRVERVFVQTPGPNAGAPLAGTETVAR